MIGTRLWGAGAILLGLLAGCTPSDKSSEPKPAGETIVIKGSDTMVHLTSAWAESFMRDEPGAEVSVTGGGSGAGIAALLNNTTDLCAASRDMTEAEKAQAAQKGIRPKEVLVARDAIAVIVHPSNPVQSFTLEQLGKIYTGAYTQWAEAGGPAGEIIVLSRESSSGTYLYFQEHVLKKQDYTAHARLMPATSSIIQAVSEDALAIGYVGLGYAVESAGKVKVVPIQSKADAAPVMPSEVTVRDGSYPISRALYFYALENTSGAVQDFLTYCQGDAGQKIVRETGYISVN